MLFLHTQTFLKANLSLDSDSQGQISAKTAFLNICPIGLFDLEAFKY